MLNRTSLIIGLTALSFNIAGGAFAEDPLYRGGFQFNDTGATPRNEDSLYKDLGGSEKIGVFTDEFVDIIAKDPQIGKYFVGINLQHLSKELTEQFIDLSGGPTKYTGRDMTEVHSRLGLSNADFNKLAEDLQVAMEHHDVAFLAQNRLIAMLASMQRAVVTK